jgi:hypothetical protein
MSDQLAREPRTWKFGMMLFAGIMMVTVGVFDLIRGLVALFSNDVLAKPDYLFAFNATTWGWIHLVIGLALIGVGLLVVAGKVIGRILGILIVFGSAMTNFASLPYAPLWSTLTLAIDILVIWALATYGADPDEV